MWAVCLRFCRIFYVAGFNLVQVIRNEKRELSVFLRAHCISPPSISQNLFFNPPFFLKGHLTNGVHSCVQGLGGSSMEAAARSANRKMGHGRACWDRFHGSGGEEDNGGCWAEAAALLSAWFDGLHCSPVTPRVQP